MALQTLEAYTIPSSLLRIKFTLLNCPSRPSPPIQPHTALFLTCSTHFSKFQPHWNDFSSSNIPSCFLYLEYLSFSSWSNSFPPYICFNITSSRNYSWTPNLSGCYRYLSRTLYPLITQHCNVLTHCEHTVETCFMK